jgi:HTH-type transcriptional regulator, transcriptional repressor of NAD biosynthesis genes
MIKGLIVGKFMPLHRGHQLLIESALAEVDELTIVVYDSMPEGDYTPMPIQKRIKWIADLYPQVYNIVPREDPLEGFIVDKDDSVFAPMYADDLEFLGKFDYVFSSEEYGEPFAKALGAKSVVIDAARTMLPISGTQIREKLYEHRGWMDPLVYRSLIQKVVFVGTESAGKSTLAERMAKELDTKWVHEYGRELWIEQDLKGSFHDLWKIAQNHYRREEAAMLHSRDYLFCDTNPWTTLQWSLMYNGTADARLYDLVKRTKDDYIWILCENDFGWVEDGVRELPGQKAIDLQEQIAANLLEFVGPNYYSVKGDLESRVDQVKGILGLKDWGSLSTLPLDSRLYL